MSWNVFVSDDAIALINESDTLITKHNNIGLSTLLEAFSKLEELDFPIEYSAGLKEIRFTYLKNKLEGDYCDDGVVRVACNNNYNVYETLLHEIGHHVDAMTDASNDQKLIEEWKRLSGSFVHHEIRTQSAEYFAIGFEHYYMNKDKLRKSNPVLYEMIDNIHKTYVA